MQLKMLVPDAAVLEALAVNRRATPRAERPVVTRVVSPGSGKQEPSIAGSQSPDHILFGNSNGFNHASQHQTKNLLRGLMGETMAQRQRRGPARLYAGQPWSVSTRPSACQLSLGLGKGYLGTAAHGQKIGCTWDSSAPSCLGVSSRYLLGECKALQRERQRGKVMEAMNIA